MKAWRPVVLKALVVAACVVAAMPASALEGRSVLGIKAKSCRFDAEAEGMTCSGPGGWKIAVGFHVLAPSLCLIRPGTTDCAPPPPTDGRMAIRIAIGSQADWHGAGVIIPVDIVVPAAYRAAIEAGEGSAQLARRPILEVMRAGREGSCTIAYVDAAEPGARALAEKVAADAANRQCPVATIATPGSTALGAYLAE